MSKKSLFKAPVPYWKARDLEDEERNHRAADQEHATLSKQVTPPAATNRQFLEPVPYVRQQNATPADRPGLESERTRLAASLPGLGFAARTRAEQRIKDIERLLASLRGDEESARRHQERQVERRSEGVANVAPTTQVRNVMAVNEGSGHLCGTNCGCQHQERRGERQRDAVGNVVATPESIRAQHRAMMTPEERRQFPSLFT